MNLTKAPRVVAIIPARAGSRGLPNKNTRRVLGRPMLSYSVDALKASELIEQSVALTNDSEFAALAAEYGFPVIDEPEEYARDGTPVEKAIDFAVGVLENRYGWKPAVIVICEPNVPVRPPNIFDEAIRAFTESGADAAYTVEPVTHHHPRWSVELIGGRIRFPFSAPQTSRQGLPQSYHLTAAAYVYRRDCLLRDTCADGAVGVVHAPGECVDVDTLFDLELAEFLIQRRLSRLGGTRDGSQQSEAE